jgi:hypothetical protein
MHARYAALTLLEAAPLPIRRPESWLALLYFVSLSQDVLENAGQLAARDAPEEAAQRRRQVHGGLRLLLLTIGQQVAGSLKEAGQQVAGGPLQSREAYRCTGSAQAQRCFCTESVLGAGLRNTGHAFWRPQAITSKDKCMLLIDSWTEESLSASMPSTRQEGWQDTTTNKHQQWQQQLHVGGPSQESKH